MTWNHIYLLSRGRFISFVILFCELIYDVLNDSIAELFMTEQYSTMYIELFIDWWTQVGS